MKSMLLRSSLNSGANGSICHEFGIQIDLFDKCLVQCLSLWKKVYSIISTLKQKNAIELSLAKQFEDANTFLVMKLNDLGKIDLLKSLENK